MLSFPVPLKHSGDAKRDFLYTDRCDHFDQSLYVSSWPQPYDMISIAYSAIPSYLHDSQFYKALDGGEAESEIQVPVAYFVTEADVKSNEAFDKMLQIMLFWGLDRIPNTMIEYCRGRSVLEWNSEVSAASNSHERDIRRDLRCVFSTENTVESDPISRAVSTGRVELVEYLAMCMDIETSVLGAAAAAKVGSQMFLEILHDAGHPWDYTATDEAARGGHLACLQYAHEHGCPVDVSACTFAAEGGHLACVQYIHRVVGTAWHRDVCSAAASNGHYDILTYAHKHGCPWDDMTVENAAKGNHVMCLQYALEECCVVCEDAIIAACQRGHYECVVLLYDYLAPMSPEVLAAAAFSGSLECVTFLREAGCEWNATATDNAARHGHYDVLRYLMDNGCPHSEQTLYLAASAKVNSLLCVKYLIEEHGLFMETDGTIFESAFERGDVECVQYLMDNGCPYEEYEFYNIINLEDTLPGAFDENLAECIRYSVEHGWVLNDDLWDYICKEQLSACRDYMEML